VFNAPVGMHRGTDQPSGLRPISLGRGTYLVILLIVVPSAAFMVWAELEPSIYYYNCVESYIPSVQERLGFRLGLVTLQGGQGQRWALIEVTPGGPLGRAGFRTGDIPVEYHGGVTAFCYALKAADEVDGYRRIDVVNIADWDTDGPNRRREPKIPKGK